MVTLVAINRAYISEFPFSALPVNRNVLLSIIDYIDEDMIALSEA